MFQKEKLLRTNSGVHFLVETPEMGPQISEKIMQVGVYVMKNEFYGKIWLELN